MVKLYDALQAVRPDLENIEFINKTKWDLLCATKVTADRCQSSFYWKCLIEAKVFNQINGKAWRVNQEVLMDFLIKNNPGNGGVKA